MQRAFPGPEPPQQRAHLYWRRSVRPVLVISAPTWVVPEPRALLRSYPAWIPAARPRSRPAQALARVLALVPQTAQPARPPAHSAFSSPTDLPLRNLPPLPGRTVSPATLPVRRRLIQRMMWIDRRRILPRAPAPKSPPWLHSFAAVPGPPATDGKTTRLNASHS